MNRRSKQIAAALTAAAAVAFGAYAVGSATGDGSATAGSRSSERDHVVFRAAEPPSLDGLAERLGVEESALREALEGIRESRPLEDPHDEFTAALASELGLPADEVRSKLDELRPERGVEPAPRPFPGGAPDGQRTRESVQGPPVAQIADALGVSEERVEEALENLHEQLDAQHAQRDDEFAEELADRLGIPVERVTDALPERPLGPGPIGGPTGPPHGPPPAR